MVSSSIFGQMLREARQLRGSTQESLARESGTTAAESTKSSL